MRRNYLWYQFFRYGIVGPALDMFYSEITVSGKNNIPKDKPIIFIPNHQNSFLDAVHVVTNTNLFIHFLTRSDPFQNPLLDVFLRSLNMLPVYRVSDGFSTVKKNNETFEKCFKRLGKGDSILVFAEATHDLKRRIRPISKGFTRIAFGAAKRNNWELDIQIIPVGFSYGQHQKSRTPVHIEFGSSIPLSDYKELFFEDEREAAQQLKKVTANRLKGLTMHVPNLGHYPFYHLMLDELEENREMLLQPNIVNQRVATLQGHVNETLKEDAKQLLDKADAKKLRLLDFIAPQKIGIKEILLSPLYLFSLLNNALPYQVVPWLTNHYLEDRVFDASVKFLVGLIFLPVFYLLIGVLLGFSGVDLPVILGYVALSITTAPMFVRAKDLLKKDTAKQLKKEDPELYDEISAKVQEFLDLKEHALE
ncbi:MAG: 1-acyl-sn-glycerol-3-phosphate acyltransferase [Balneolaceae bacterium]|nr:1-acyl-sn-glycerol-3-phosphate acyltransferase [Balneolaceae bacterium]